MSESGFQLALATVLTEPLIARKFLDGDRTVFSCFELSDIEEARLNKLIVRNTKEIDFVVGLLGHRIEKNVRRFIPLTALLLDDATWQRLWMSYRQQFAKRQSTIIEIAASFGHFLYENIDVADFVTIKRSIILYEACKNKVVSVKKDVKPSDIVVASKETRGLEKTLMFTPFIDQSFVVQSFFYPMKSVTTTLKASGKLPEFPVGQEQIFLFYSDWRTGGVGVLQVNKILCALVNEFDGKRCIGKIIDSYIKEKPPTHHESIKKMIVETIFRLVEVGALVLREIKN